MLCCIAALHAILYVAYSSNQPCMQAATPLSAVFQFFVRDFTAMLGGILFAFCQVHWGHLHADPITPQTMTHSSAFPPVVQN